MPSLPLPNIWEIHPMLVHFPIALLLAGVAADILGRKREIVRRAAAGLLVGGVVLGWVTAGAGLLAYYTVPAHTEQAHAWMNWHLWAALGMLALFTVLAVVRWRGRARMAGAGTIGLGLLSAGLLLFTGYLGGAIVYHGGAGIDPELLSREIREGHHHGGAGGHGDESHDGGHAPGEESPGEGHSHSLGNGTHSPGKHDH